MTTRAILNRRTRQQLAEARRRASVLGQPVELTLAEWRAIVAQGDGCAVCGEEPKRGTVLSFSGACTARTALPLCRGCHLRRMADDLPGIHGPAASRPPVHLWRGFASACGEPGQLSTSWGAITCQACKGAR
jgi:hypothetical protein